MTMQRRHYAIYIQYIDVAMKTDRLTIHHYLPDLLQVNKITDKFEVKTFQLLVFFKIYSILDGNDQRRDHV